MSYWDKKPNVFRNVMIVVSALLFSLIAYNFVMNVSSPTDENTFGNPPSRFYIQKSFVALKNVNSNEYDTVKIGNLLIEINDTAVKNPDQLESILADIDSNEFVKLFVVDHKTLNLIEYFSTRAGQKTLYIQKKYLPDVFLRYLKSVAYVDDVHKGGASDRAGMQKGDYIIKINGKEFRNALHLDFMLRSGKSGSIIEYEILRGNVEFTLKVKLAKFGITLDSLVFYLAGICFFALGLFIIIKRPALKAARLLGMGFLVFGFLLGAVLSRYQIAPGIIESIRMILIVFSYIFVYPIFFHSIAYFPVELPKLIQNKWLIRIPYAVSALLFVVLVIEIYFTDGALSRHLTNLPLNQFWTLFLTGIWTALNILYFIAVRIFFRSYFTKEHWRITRTIRYALVLVLLFAVIRTYFIPEIIIFASPIILAAMFVLIPLSFLYTIGRYRLLDLQIRLRRNIQYVLISVAVKVFFAFIIVLLIWGISHISLNFPNLHFTGTSIEVLDKPLRPELSEYYNKMFLIIIAVIAALVFWKIVKNTQKFLDRKFYQSGFDYKKASSEFSDIFVKNLDMDDLARGIINKIAQLVLLKRVGIIFIKNENTVCGQEYYGFISKSLKEFNMAIGQKLAASLKSFSGEFSVDYLQEPIKSVYRECDFRFILPIKYKQKVVGAILIGEKLSESPYLREDFEFLLSIASQSSVAVENSFLYEELSQQERFKHELEIAKRIQLASLPQDIPNIQGLDIAGISVPALEVGGDYYDFLEINDHEVLVVVGDVSGKGTSAALYMSKIQGIIRTLHEFHLTPKILMEKSNNILYKNREKRTFISSLMTQFDTSANKALVARAGHLPLYVFRKEANEIHKFTPKGIALGITSQHFFNGVLEQIEIEIHPGDAFLFITDGIIEARNKYQDDFGEEKLLRVFKEYANSSSDEIVKNIHKAVSFYVDEHDQFDDLTIVAVKVI